MFKTQIVGTERPKRKLETEANGEKSENERPQKIWRPWETTGGDLTKDGDTEVVDPPEEFDHFNNFLNLPDVPFNLFAMMLSITQLRGLSQVSSSWRKRISENILENPARKNELRARIQRAIVPKPIIKTNHFMDMDIEYGYEWTEYQYPSNEDISNAMWLSKYDLS